MFLPASGVTAIAAGYWHTVALKSDGTVVAWGHNFNGQTTVPPGERGDGRCGGSWAVALKAMATVVAWETTAKVKRPFLPSGVDGRRVMGTVALKRGRWWRGDNRSGQTTVPPASGVTAARRVMAHRDRRGTVVAWGTTLWSNDRSSRLEQGDGRCGGTAHRGLERAMARWWRGGQ